MFDDQEIEIRVLFDRGRYRDEVVQRIVDYFVTALAELIRDEHRKMAAIDVLPPVERRRVLFDWNDTTRPFERKLIHAPFERRSAAGRKPSRWRPTAHRLLT